MVHSIVECASRVWDPYTVTNINKLEPIQRAGDRFCFNNFLRQSSITGMLTALDLHTCLKVKKNVNQSQTYNDVHYKIINIYLAI